MKAARILDVPVIVTEQYPKRLLPTGTSRECIQAKTCRRDEGLNWCLYVSVSELQPLINPSEEEGEDAFAVFPKLKFSMMTEEVSKAAADADTVVLFGIEVWLHLV